MIEKTDDVSPGPPTTDPIIKPRRSISIVWLVPVVALLVGGWLAYKAITEKGPVITIKFATADGLEAGKTKVKYKSVDVGVVESIDIGENFSQVILRVQLNKGAEPYLTDQTKFWVVRARISATEVSGLSTLLGGAYIGVEPSDKGKPLRDFVGLEAIPLVTSASKGKRFKLVGPRLGSLNPGSPIYFRQVKVGQVVDYRLEEKGDNVGVNIFIENPYDQFVLENTRFWLASGLDMQLTANGIRVDTDSVVSLMIGGLAFENFSHTHQETSASENMEFKLYETREEAQDDQYTLREQYYLEFFESIRGLSIGAPVEFRGIQIGTVTDIELKITENKMNFSTMVGVTIERERLGITERDNLTPDIQIKKMIKDGLRVQLNTGNLLTGQLFVDVNYYPDAPLVEETVYKDLLVIPSIPSSTQAVIAGVTNLIKRIDTLPIEEIGQSLQGSLSGIEKLVNSPDVQQSMQSLQEILADLELTTKNLNADTMPEVTATLEELHDLIKEVKGSVSTDSPLQENLLRSLQEIGKAARSINNLADMLDRHPEALIQGKKLED
ncbi:MlaD family protein [Desulfogranum marinum]|uniref:PqiB family protein n=1 Tax=Desulfogranum marinum TaxID=453220 RepID=UPI0029C664EF|nr:MlaD family protein [Desulfogranum marinum]